MTSCSLFVGKQISLCYFAEESNIQVTGIQRERIRNIFVSKKYDILKFLRVLEKKLHRLFFEKYHR